MCNSKCPSDLTQIARATLELLHRGAANHFEVCDLCQAREYVVVNAGREVFVLFIITQIFEWQNRNTFFGNISRRGRADSRWRDQSWVGFIRSHDSLRSQIKYPRQ